MGRFNRGASTNLIYIMFDILFGLLAYILAGLFSRMGTTFLEQSYFLICVAFMLIFVLANKESRLYNVTTFFYVDRIIKRVTKSFIIAGGVTSTLLFYVGRAKVDQRFYIIYLVTSFVLLLGNAFFVRYVLMKRLADAPRTR